MDMHERQDFSGAQDAAVFEGTRLAYIKPIGAGEAQAQGLIPKDAHIPRGTKLFTVHAADGTPFAITDSWAGAYGAAVQNEMVPLSVH